MKNIGIICTLLTIFIFLAYEGLGLNILHIDLSNLQNIRYGSLRISIAPNFCFISYIILLYEFLAFNKHKFSNLCWMVIILFCQIFIGKTRGFIISYIVISMFMIFYYYKKNGIFQFINFVFCISVIVGVLINFNKLTNYLISYINGDDSIMTRFSEIEYYCQQWTEFPLFGTGFITTNSQAFLLFRGGITGHFSTVDIGILGFLNEFGILGVLLAVLFLFLNIKDAMRMHLKEKIVFVTFIFFELITMATLFFFRHESTMLIFITLLLNKMCCNAHKI